MWGVSYFTYHKKMNSWFCTNWSEGYPLSEGTFSQEIWNPVARQRLLSIYVQYHNLIVNLHPARGNAVNLQPKLGEP